MLSGWLGSHDTVRMASPRRNSTVIPGPTVHRIQLRQTVYKPHPVPTGTGCNASPARKVRAAYPSTGGAFHHFASCLRKPRALCCPSLLDASLHQLQAAANALQHVVEVMCNPTRELTQSFHLLRLAQLRFGLTAFGNLDRFRHDTHD